MRYVIEVLSELPRNLELTTAPGPDPASGSKARSARPVLSPGR